MINAGVSTTAWVWSHVSQELNAGICSGNIKSVSEREKKVYQMIACMEHCVMVSMTFK